MKVKASKASTSRYSTKASQDQTPFRGHIKERVILQIKALEVPVGYHHVTRAPAEANDVKKRHKKGTI